MTRQDALRRKIPFSGGSLAKLELLGDRSIAAHIRVMQVIKQPPALADHHEQTPPGTVILQILLEMFGEVIDALGQQGNLDIGRAGVTFVQLEIRNS